jgi:class 3 adenylate cyclase
VTGDAVNMAARLEHAAAPGEIVLGPLTWRLVRDAVAAEPLGQLRLKGKSQPVTAYRLLRACGGDAGARLDGAPLVGTFPPARPARFPRPGARLCDP